jgi:hypothetical protein
MTDSLYTPALADEICRRVSEGESVRAICRDPGMPSEGTVRAWSREDRGGFAARFRIARDLQLDCWSDQIVDLADRGELDPRDRAIRIDTRKWVMSKLAPRRYGDRLLVSGEAENPLVVMHKHVSLDSLSLGQLDALEAFAQSVVEQRLDGGASQPVRLLAHHRRGTP